MTSAGRDFLAEAALAVEADAAHMVRITGTASEWAEGLPVEARVVDCYGKRFFYTHNERRLKMSSNTSARPKGYAPWGPRRKTQDLLEQVDTVLREYEDFLPLTIRQIFYRLVGAFDFEKTERGYSRLQECLARARRSGRIPFDAVRDDGWQQRRPITYDGVPEFLAEMGLSARNFRIDKQRRQPFRCVVMVEAAGMVPQAVKVAHGWDVPVFSSGGFDSLTIKHDLARLAMDLSPVVFLHVGDYDPSGVCIFESVEADVLAFVDGSGTGFDLLDDLLKPVFDVRFERVAVTPEQIEEYALPSAPAKATDRRGNGVEEAVQAEALPPETLAQLLKEAILRHTDIALFDADLERERTEQARLLEILSRIEGNAE